MLKQLIISPLFAALVLSSTAFADTEIITGTLTPTTPRYDRPDENANLVPNSLNGTPVPYEVFPFFATASDAITFAITDSQPQLPDDFDTYAILYAGSFDPGNPLLGAVIADDDDGDGPAGHWSAFTSSVQAGVQYYLVVAGYDELDDFGTYSGSLSTSGLIGRGLVAGAAPTVKGPKSVEGGKKSLVKGKISGLIAADRVQFKIPGSPFRNAKFSLRDKTRGVFSFQARLKNLERGKIVVKATNALGQKSKAFRIKIK